MFVKDLSKLQNRLRAQISANPKAKKYKSEVLISQALFSHGGKQPKTIKQYQ